MLLQTELQKEKLKKLKMKPLEQKKHREFYMRIPSDGFSHDFITNISGASQWPGRELKFIEYSALEEMEKRAEELVKALEFYAGDNYESVYEDDEMDLNRLLDRDDVSFDETDKYFGCAGSKAREALKQWRKK